MNGFLDSLDASSDSSNSDLTDDDLSATDLLQFVSCAGWDSEEFDAFVTRMLWGELW
jgi:hypothetical protein